MQRDGEGKGSPKHLDEETLRGLVDAAFDALVVTRKGLVMFANRSFVEMSGWNQDEILGRSVLDFVAPEWHPFVMQQMTRPTDARYEAVGVRRDGSRLDVEICAKECTYEGEPARVTAIRYITERKQAEHALRRSEARLRELIERMPDMIVVYRAGVLVFVNPAGLAYLGYDAPEDLVGKPVTSIVHPDDHALVSNRIRELTASGQPGGLETFRSVRRDGSAGVIEIVSVPIDFDDEPAILVLGRDVEARKQMEGRLLQADLLASVGMLAAGIAHEINNPLAYITINLGIMTRKLAALTSATAALATRQVEYPFDATQKRDDPAPAAALDVVGIHRLARELGDLLVETRDGADRVGHIVRDFKLFARGDSGRRRPLDLRSVLDSTLKIVFNEIRHRARLVKDYGQAPLVEADEARLGQLFLNTLVNALQALPETGFEQNHIKVTLRTAADGWAVVEISDTGSGIPPEILGRVFEPFFSTKPIGVGTGLGLSICHSIVSALGGRIELESEVGRGTSCRISLPPARADAAVPRTRERVAAVPPVQRLRLLVIDDEQGLVRSLCAELSHEHDVTSATTGGQAIGLALDQRFDVILCDLMMPGVSGIDVFEAVRKARPGEEGRFVFMTGGAFTSASRDFLARVANRRIEKPFTWDDLREVLRDAVSQSRAGRVAGGASTP